MKRRLSESKEEEEDVDRSTRQRIDVSQDMTLQTLGRLCVDNEGDSSYSALREYASKTGWRPWIDYTSKPDLCRRFADNLGFPVQEVSANCSSLSNYDSVRSRVDSLGILADRYADQKSLCTALSPIIGRVDYPKEVSKKVEKRVSKKVDYPKEVSKKVEKRVSKIIVDEGPPLYQEYIPDTNYRMVFLGDKGSKDLLKYIPVPPRVSDLESLSIRLTLQAYTPNKWVSLLLDENEKVIIGYYSGFISMDQLNRRFSHQSYIKILPSHQGKGLCAPFAAFSYGCLNRIYNVVYICLVVAADDRVNACRCYSRAARLGGYIPYLKTTQVGLDRNVCKQLSSPSISGRMLLVREGVNTDSSMEYLCYTNR
jgi:hypothetical protein